MAAIIVERWAPFGAAFARLLFGAVAALELRLHAGLPVPYYVIEMPRVT